jgi:hypothetical protein
MAEDNKPNREDLTNQLTKAQARGYQLIAASQAINRELELTNQEINRISNLINAEEKTKAGPGAE